MPNDLESPLASLLEGKELVDMTPEERLAFVERIRAFRTSSQARTAYMKAKSEEVVAKPSKAFDEF